MTKGTDSILGEILSVSLDNGNNTFISTTNTLACILTAIGEISYCLFPDYFVTVI